MRPQSYYRGLHNINKYANVNVNLLALYLNAFIVAFPCRGHRLQRDEGSKRSKQLKHAHAHAHVHVYIIYSHHLTMLIYYYFLTLLFTVADLLADKVIESVLTCVEPQKLV